MPRSINALDAVKSWINLLKNADIVASLFDADEVLDHEMDFINAVKSALFEKLAPLVGKVKEETAIESADNMPKEYNAGSSQ
ncbi:unnamed protein product [Peronospora belbahrii]|uniref:Uncharacterized protein n=1 Tax=Peronospora belbahrii TaxID=622444 RepID=A0AAU9L4I2_9STRA|nr:unnamed protein product [Peronospora belbahrii]